MVSKDSAIRSLRLEFHSCFGIGRAAALMFALVLFVAIAPIPLSSSSEMPRTAMLSKRAPVAKSVVAAAYGKLPLSFEINQGQTDPRVKFLSRGSGYSLFLTGSEAVLRLRKSTPVSKTEAGIQTVSFKPRLRQAKVIPTIDSVVRMRLVGANPSAKVSGLDELSGKSNYFIGNDPRKWRTNLPNYAEVKYANVYSGVDLVYYGNQRQLEYDFVLRPGADPRQLALSFDGAKRLRLAADGALIISIAGGEIVEHKPVIYQDLGGRRRQVAGGYVLKNDHAVGFRLAGYDAHRSLTIDPTLAYSTYLGGSNDNSGIGIAVDAAGHAYVTGSTSSTDFPTTSGAFQTTLRGFSAAFVSKLNSSGSALVYSTYLGGSNDDDGSGIAVDAAGHAYVTGYTESANFPVTPGALQTTLGGFYDSFVSKLDSSGSALMYSTYLGGSSFDYAGGIALDSSGDAYISGVTGSNNFSTTPAAFQTTLRGFSDAFVSKLNSSGSALVYSTYLGGSNDDDGSGIAVDASGHAYVTGYTRSSDFPTTARAFQTIYGGGDGFVPGGDAFVSKLNSSGSALMYSTYLGGTHNDLGDQIAVDSSGHAYVTGYTRSSDFPTTTGALQTSFGGGDIDGFVSKLNPSGSALVYSTYLGGSSYDDGLGIAPDSAGNAYVTGYTRSSDFPTTSGAFQTTLRGFSAAFVSKLNPRGSALVYSTYLGGSSYDFGDGIALDSAGNAYVTGRTDSTDFPVTAGAFQTTHAGGDNDVFVSKFDFAGIPFSSFGGRLRIDPDAGVFFLKGSFTLGPGGRIDPATEPVHFGVGNYAVILPPGSFLKVSTGYVYQKRVDKIFLCVYIRNTSMPGRYSLLANRSGGTLNTTTSHVPVTLTIGNDSGTTRMRAKFD